MQKPLSSVSTLLLGAAALLSTTQVFGQSPCPEQFHTLPVTDDARFCQVFDDALPASLSFHSAHSNDAALSFYLQQLTQAQQSTSKGRQVLESPQGNWVVVISNDGTGSQIDILVKSEVE